MSDERMDELLEEALATGDVRGDATADERAEIERLLEAARLLATTRHATEREAEAALLAARTRFQRHVRARPPSALDAISRPQMLPWGRRVPRQATWALAGAAGVVAVVALAAVLLWTNVSEPESAYAQVVEPGDYVQVEGVVEEATSGGEELTLASVLGEIEVSTEDAEVAGGPSPGAVSSLRRGDRVLVSGIAGEGRHLVARTLAVSDVAGVPSGVASFRELRRARAELEGVVVTYAISSDGHRATLVVETVDGTRYEVPVDGDSATRLLEAASTALGRRVAVRAQDDRGTLVVELQEDFPSTAAAGLTSIRGLIVDAQVAPHEMGSTEPTIVLTVQTPGLSVRVAVPGGARSYVGRSGIEAGPRLLLRAVGHMVSIAGSGNPARGEVTADVIVLGPKAERPGRR